MFLFYLVGLLISIKSHIALNGTACKKVVFLGVLLVLGFILLFFIYFLVWIFLGQHSVFAFTDNEMEKIASNQVVYLLFLFMLLPSCSLDSLFRFL